MNENDKDKIDKLAFNEAKYRPWWAGFVKDGQPKPMWVKVLEGLGLTILILIGAVVLLVGGCLAIIAISNIKW